MDRTMISVRGIGKQYQLGLRERNYQTLREAVSDFARAPLRRLRHLAGRSSDRADVFWALRDVSFNVNAGDIVGIVGRNGAGKSTLLKILSRITHPTTGRAEIRGTIASLLEVGTGFHPELSGRENVFLNGAILGMKHAEMARKFDEIVDFAGIEKFIDTPIKHYSSGMTVRLAFAVAAHLEPEILIIDEVLAVGDAQFQKKCLGKMSQIAEAGRTILFVSHNLGAVRRLCSRAILLQNGQVSCDGTTEQVLSEYLSEIDRSTTATEYRVAERPDIPLQVVGISVVDPLGNPTCSVGLWDQVCLRVEYVVRKDLVGTNLSATVSKDGTVVYNTFDIDLSPEHFDLRRAGRFRAVVPMPVGLLPAGRYSVSVDAGITCVSALDRHTDAVSFEVNAEVDDLSHKSYSRPATVIVRLPWEVSSIEGDSGKSSICDPPLQQIVAST